MESQSTQTKRLEEMYITAYWRRTGMGGISHPIAMKFDGNRLRIVRPTREEYSRSHNHGTWYYLRSEVDILLYLEQSNSGKRSIILSICNLPQEICGRVVDTAETLWVGTDSYTSDVEKALILLQF